MQFKLNNDKMCILNAKKIKNFFNLIRQNSVVHTEELIKWIENIKRQNEMVSDFIHHVIHDKVNELKQDEKNGRIG